MWKWKLLRAGAFRLDGGGMFGVVPKTIWSRMVEADENNRIGMQTNCLLLEDGRKKVLVETGYGDKWTPKERGFWDLEDRTVVDALREAGCSPVTHLHFDHAAALTRNDADGNPVPTFPNARIVTQQQEWDDALANKSTMHRTEGIVCFPGDVMPTIHHAGPTTSMGYDMLPYVNMQSKAQLLDRARRESWRLVLDHEPGNPVVRVSEDPERAGRFRLEPQEIAGAV
ncbi:MAG: MBL fold metallo-hydrolase [Planctomycetota bacterium]|jgi:glyoxylase-like metal-dependent hydrolase (beta-lactamase superfamily II)